MTDTGGVDLSRQICPAFDFSVLPVLSDLPVFLSVWIRCNFCRLNMEMREHVVV